MVAGPQVQEEYVSYIWDFGDSSPTVNGANINHSYSNAQAITTLHLTVSDGICTGDTTLNINVIQTPIAPSPADV